MEGSVHAPRLGLDVHVEVHDGRLRRVRLLAPGPGPAPPPAALAPLLARILRHCETGREGFGDVPLDLDGVSPFDREVLATLTREVPPGRVVTYAELARMLGRPPTAARAVGGAMARNPIPLVVPCHRVVPAGDRIGSYSGEGGWETKMKLLRLEGASGLWAQTRLG